jgi:hypoxanthine phosphoribosyltransferase
VNEPDESFRSLPPHDVKTFLTEEVIQKRVVELGDHIGRDFPEETIPLVLLGILKGSVLFLADLARAIQRPVEYDFVEISSYGSGTETSGEIRIVKDLETELAGKDVLIVEDILDSGLTIEKSKLFSKVIERNARSVHLCVLLNKASRRRVEVPVSYSGFVIEDVFVVGYGMDFAGRYRNLKFIGAVEFVSPE